MADTHQASGSRQAITTAHDWLQLLAGVPFDWALIPLNDRKCPIDPGTGQPLQRWTEQPGYTPEQFTGMNGYVRAVGVLLGSASGNLLAVDFDGPGAIECFQQITGHDPGDLPKTVAVTSGRFRRQQQFFTVDPDWIEYLRPRQFKVSRSGASNPRTVLEFRWAGQQSVIAGDHPDTAGYRWLDGCSPSEIELAPAPVWLLEAVVTGGPQDTTPPPAVRVNSDDSDRARAMLQRLPPAQFESYDAWLEVGMALHGTDPGLLSAWVEWSRSMQNFDETECLQKWQSFGRYPGRSRTIASLHRLAKQHGYREPKRQQPQPPASAPAARSDALTPGERLTLAQVDERLREAIADGVGGAELAVLVAELTSASEQGSINVQRLADAIRTEQLQAAAVAAEAHQLAIAADRKQLAQTLTPAHLLPPAIATAIETRARYLPCDGPSAVLPFLAAVAGLVKLGTEVEASAVAGYRVPINLFACLVGRSGAKKSPVGRLLLEAPMADLKAELLAANERDREAWADACSGLKKGEARPPAPQPKRLAVSDYTGEALAAQLQVQEAAGLGLLIHRDELSGLFGSLNAYRGGRGADEQQLLELFDGAGLNSLRITGDRHYKRSQCSIFGSTQPEVLRQLVADGDASGLWARFLFVPLPERAVPLPLATTPAEVAQVEAAAQELAAACRNVYCLPPKTCRLSPAAAERFAHYELQRQQAALKAAISAQSALYGKSAGKVLRVAGVLHLLQIAAGAINTDAQIDTATIERAAALVDHLDAWALGLHAEVASGGVGQLMRTVHRAAEAAGKPIRLKELLARLSSKQRREIDAAAFAEAARALETAGYGETETGRRGAVSYSASRELP